MSDTQNIHVLYVDDEGSNLTGFKASFRRDFTVFTAGSAEEAEAVLSQNEIHVLVTDHKMPVTMGTELLQKAVINYPLQSRIMLTAHADIQSVFDAFHKGEIYRYVLKPWNEDNLRKNILEAYEVYKLKRLKEDLYQEYLKTTKEIEELRNK